MPMGPLVAELRSRIGNRLGARSFARQAAGTGPVPDEGIAVFFATPPQNAYQLEQWRRPLEALAAGSRADRRGVFVVVDRPDTGRRLLETFRLPVAFARGSAALESLVERHRPRAVLYVNNVERNFRMLRFADPVHIQLGHGDSDKGASVTNQHKAYDLTFVAGEAGRDRLARALFDFDARSRVWLVGRPQLDYDVQGAPDWPADGTSRVLYAPTWEGDRPSLRYSSVVSHGPALIAALRADPRVRVVYRPHPWLGRISAEHARVDRELRAALMADGDRHLVDTGTYGWQWTFADACIADVSAVAYDWLATRKPLVVTRPEAEEAYLPPSRLLDSLPLLGAADAGSVARELLDSAPPAELAGLAEYYFGDTSRGASTNRFEQALEDAIEARAVEIAARPAG
jgi:hypothetical protein